MRRRKMMNNNLFPIAKEGWAHIGYSVVLFLVLGFLDLDFLQFFSFVLILFLVYIYRNPERQIMALEKGGVLSPVDGKIVDIQKNSDSLVISVESTYNDVSVLRVPIAGSVKTIEHIKGASLHARSPKADKLNEKFSVNFTDDQNRIVNVEHLSTLNFSDISYDLYESQKLIQGSRYGVMLKGVTQISLPKDSKLNVAIGNDIKACESIIAYLF
jgi:phosphatidylserine decarboxylase